MVAACNRNRFRRFGSIVCLPAKHIGMFTVYSNTFFVLMPFLFVRSSFVVQRTTEKSTARAVPHEHNVDFDSVPDSNPVEIDIEESGILYRYPTLSSLQHHRHRQLPPLYLLRRCDLRLFDILILKRLNQLKRTPSKKNVIYRRQLRLEFRPWNFRCKLPRTKKYLFFISRPHPIQWLRHHKTIIVKIARNHNNNYIYCL